MSSVSIALCTYNGERFLQQQLDSLARQTQLPDEVIVSDDASTDGTIAILESWKNSVPFPVKIYHHVPAGVNKNFENVISLCTKDIILICDQDDIWIENKIERLVKILDENPQIGAVFHDASMIDENSDVIENASMTQFARFYMVNDYPVFLNPDTQTNYNPSGCCSAYRANLIKQTIPFSNDFIYDQWLFACANALAEKCAVPDMLIKHRIHDNNVTASNNNELDKNSKDAITRAWYITSAYKYIQFKPLIDAVKEFIIQNIPESKYKNQYIRYLEQTETHVYNRIRIRRNAILFSTMIITELFRKYGYFHYFQPLRSLFYDIRVGLLNAINPISIYREITNLIQKKMS